MYIHVFAKTSVAFFSKLRRDGVSEETRKSTFHKYLHTQYAYTSSHIHVQLNPDIGAELVTGNMAMYLRNISWNQFTLWFCIIISGKVDLTDLLSKIVRLIFKAQCSVLVWKNDKFYLTEKIFREINYLVISLVKPLLSRNFYQKTFRSNVHNGFHEIFVSRL